jgi:hypothetical protein
MINKKKRYIVSRIAALLLALLAVVISNCIEYNISSIAGGAIVFIFVGIITAIGELFTYKY